MKKKYLKSKLYKQAIYLFFYREEYITVEYITKVIVYKLKGEIVLEITTHRPGLIIGKAGNTIHALQKYIETRLGKTIKISLKESTIWKNIYK